MRITAITPSRRQPQRVVIRVEGRSIATLPHALVASLGLKVGDAWSEALAKRVAQAATYDKALRAAMRRLDRRAMSTRQLADKLRTLGFEPSVIEQVTARLTELGALNDRAYGEALIR